MSYDPTKQWDAPIACDVIGKVKNSLEEIKTNHGNITPKLKTIKIPSIYKIKDAVRESYRKLGIDLTH